MKIIKTTKPENINHAEINTRIGKIYYTHDGKSVFTVSFSKSSSLNPKLFGKNVKITRKRLRSFESELKKYFSGKNKIFRTRVKILTGSDFESRILRAMAKVPYGKTVSYKELARKIKKPGSSRAVGNACGKNPCAIIIPCHRIIRDDGTLGGFSAGLSIKKKLHLIEGIRVKK